ncbi:MAG TPA: pitrilysin family protein [Armatimonadota bacterium]|nr:pitrilysin family protein [Armatimonadota bacterium]
MAGTTIRTYQLKNGLSLVSEAIPEARAAAFQLMTPAGALTEPAETAGGSSVLENICYRGAGSRDARQISDALDELGIQRGGGADLETTTFAGALLADDLDEALSIYADVVRRPTIPPDQLEGARQLALQRLESIKDNPTQQLFIELSRIYFPGPHGRSPLGSRQGIEAITVQSLREDHRRRYVPDGSILGVAGRFDWDRLIETTERLFGDWEGASPPAPAPDSSGREHYKHIQEQSAQEQIGLAWPEVTAEHPDFYASRVAIQVLSGGMGARLFTEVREKRGLVYSVAAFPRTVRGEGLALAYAGTTPERRQECLDVLIGELRRLPEGITEEELARARTGLLSSQVMQGESCSARAAAITRDQFTLGRIRPLDEVRAGIEQVTTDSVHAHLQRFPPADFTIVTLGPEPVEVKQV